MVLLHKLHPIAAMAAASGAAMALSLVAGCPSAEAAAAPADGSAVCAASFPIALNGFAFTPATVVPGGSATADLITTNCSNAAVDTTEMWSGQWLPLSSSGALPTGCPIIDPLLRAVDYRAGQEVAENTVYTVPTGCHAAELQVTVRITGSNGALGLTATAVLDIVQITPGS
ncbi:hypothetical protein [Actinospica robiniae]|uniref:Secreted protein n=1 Tax=Actinospica robiniae DSM 44927 TaxID=479430 RepID=W9E4D2_9ACTN|nr:hypothetical protein [Actinospica robiniae]ETA71012.1 hypothetical protein ActroDRAFT_0030 [Actinospica robiniae DSM 44927]